MPQLYYFMLKVEGEVFFYFVQKFLFLRCVWR